MKIYKIDGKNFETLEEFYGEISRVIIPEEGWGHNLDAFNDILRGGFGTPDEGFTIKWLNSELSKEKLGYPETIRQLRKRLERCHPDNRECVKRQLERAEKSEGATVFDWLLNIILAHGPDGEESEDNVQLVLE